jgi:molecular chaperone DnaK
VEEAVQGDDKDVIDEAAKVLSEASAGLAQKLYAEQAEAGEQGEQGEGQQAPGDDAMDAEFEEVKDEDVKEDSK